MTTTAIWASIFVVLVSVVADVTTRRIPNVVTLGGFFLALAIHGAAGFVSGGAAGAMHGIGWAMLGGLACGIIPMLAWKKGELGGGDVKLFIAIGALVGPTLGFDVEARTFAFSFLVLFPYRLIRHRALGAALRNARIGIANLFAKKDAQKPYESGPKLPPVILAPAIGVAFALTIFQAGALR